MKQLSFGPANGHYFTVGELSKILSALPNQDARVCVYLNEDTIASFEMTGRYDVHVVDNTLGGNKIDLGIDPMYNAQEK